MCIRDRDMTGALTKVDEKVGVFNRQVSELNKSPVSYTHLRAHETRHDLVCRLLLEHLYHQNYRHHQWPYIFLQANGCQ